MDSGNKGNSADTLLRKSLAYHSISGRSYNHIMIISCHKQWYYKDLLNYI